MGLYSVSKTSKVFILFAALLGVAASFQLLLEKINLLSDSNYVPSCSINPIFSCGSVMKSWQANTLLGSNILVGVFLFSMLLGVAVMLFSRTKIRRWVIWGLAVGSLFGSGFSMWLMTQSLYDINKLCLYCMVVWCATIILTVTIWVSAVGSGAVKTTEKFQQLVAKLAPQAWSLVVLWLAVVAALIILKFPNVLVF